MTEPCIITGLMAEGWTRAAARQHVRERFRRRSDALAIEAASGDGCNRRPFSADQRQEEVAPFHGPTMERKHEPSPEKLFTEIGKSRDDHVPGHDC